MAVGKWEKKFFNHLNKIILDTFCEVVELEQVIESVIDKGGFFFIRTARYTRESTHLP